MPHGHFQLKLVTLLVVVLHVVSELLELRPFDLVVVLLVELSFHEQETIIKLESDPLLRLSLLK